MADPKHGERIQRHAALSGAAQAVIDAEVRHRDVKTARLKKARLAEAIEIGPEKSKDKP